MHAILAAIILCVCTDANVTPQVKWWSIKDASIYTQVNYDFGKIWQQEIGFSSPIATYGRFTLGANVGLQANYPYINFADSRWTGSVTLSYSFR